MRTGLIADSMAPYAVERVSVFRIVGYNPATMQDTGFLITPEMIVSISYVRERADTAKSQMTVVYKYDVNASDPPVLGVTLRGRTNEVGQEPIGELLIDRFEDVEILYDRLTRTATMTAERKTATLTAFGRTKGTSDAYMTAVGPLVTYSGSQYATPKAVMQAAYDTNTAAGKYTLNLIAEDGIDGISDELNAMYKAALTDRMVTKGTIQSAYNDDFVQSVIDAVNVMLMWGRTYERQTSQYPSNSPRFEFYDEELQQTVTAVYALDAYIDELGNIYVGWFRIYERYRDADQQYDYRYIPRYNSIYDYPGEHGTITDVVFDSSMYTQVKIAKDTLYGASYEIDYRGDVRLMIDDVIGLKPGAWTVNGATREGHFNGTAGTAEQMRIKRLNLNYAGGVLSGQILCVPYTTT